MARRSQTLEAFFLTTYRIGRNLEPATQEEYRRAIAAFGRWLGRTPRLCDLTDKTVAEWGDFLLARDKAAATVNKGRRTLRALAAAAFMAGEIPKALSLRQLREPKRAVYSWEPCEVGAILHQCRLVRGMVAGYPASDFWSALVLCGYDTGVRISALLNTLCGDYDPATGWLLIRAEVQKQDADQRFLVSAETTVSLRKLWEPRPTRWLFPWPFDRYEGSTWTALYKHFRRIVQRAGVDAAHGLFHRLRKTTATQLELVSPGLAQKMLGHSSAAVTRRYIDETKLPGWKVADKLARPR